MKHTAICVALCLAFGQAQAGKFVRGTRSGGSQLTMSWNNIPTHRQDGTGSPITLIIQTARCSTTRGWPYASFTTAVSLSAKTAIVTGLVSGTTYYCVLTATSASGEGTTSSEVSAVAP